MIRLNTLLLFFILYYIGMTPSQAYHINYIPVDEDMYHWYRLMQFDPGFYTDHPYSTQYYLYQDQLNLKTLDLQSRSPELSWASKLLYQNQSINPSNLMSLLSFKNQTEYVQHHHQSDSLISRLRITFSLEYRLNSQLSFFSRFYADTKGLKDSQYPGHRWGASNSDLAGMNDIAILIYRHPFWGDFTLGKQYLYWGHPSSGALMLSNNSPPMNMIHYQKKRKSYLFTYFTAQLNDIFPQENNDYYQERINRYLSAHRLDIQLTKKIQLALSEMVLYGGNSRKIEWYYVNPFSIYFLEQFTTVLPFTSESSEDDNLFLDLELFWKIKPQWNVYLDWFIDDFQYDMVSEPNEISFTAGIDYLLNHRFFHGYWNIEYTRINNWVYGQNKPWNRFLHYNSIIGHYMGPDGHQIKTEFQSVLNPQFQTRFTGTWQAKGQGSLYDERESVVPDTRFPSGIVTRSYQLELSLIYQPLISHQIWIGMKWEKIKNLHHDPGNQDTGLSVNLGFTYHWLTNPLIRSVFHQFQ